jgi:hypothetical protein
MSMVAENIANHRITAIPFCNSNHWGLDLSVDSCANVRLRNSIRPYFRMADRPSVSDEVRVIRYKLYSNMESSRLLGVATAGR